MSTAVLPPPVRPMRAPIVQLSPQPVRWTCVEFHNMGDRGMFEHRRVFLIDGELFEMPSPNPPHSTAKALVEETLRAAFGVGFLIRTENPLVLGRSTDPVPDLAVVTGSVRDYARSHPTTAVLVVEVADSSLGYDLGDKASLYAAAGIADYWVVDLVNRQVVVMRNPVVDATRKHGYGYSTVTNHAVGQGVSPLAAPAAVVAVADVMP